MGVEQYTKSGSAVQGYRGGRRSRTGVAAVCKESVSKCKNLEPGGKSKIREVKSKRQYEGVKRPGKQGAGEESAAQALGKATAPECSG